MEKISYVKKDIHPLSWLSPFSQNSVKHILKMAIIYHIIGILLIPIGFTTSSILIPDYELPLIPFSLIELISAGPAEESLFFGLPYYLTGNQFVVLGTGIVWALIHTLNITEEEVTFSNLNYSNFFFVIPSLFFSLRTWITGKGWLAILIHSSWNGLAFEMGCAFEDTGCSLIGENPDDVYYTVFTIIMAITLLGITYLAYRRRK